MRIALLLIATLLPYHSFANTQHFDPSKYISQIMKVEKYLSSFTTLTARFTETYPKEGAMSRGKIYISRPGKARWEYFDPKPILMIVKNSDLVYYDKKLDQVTYTSLPENPIEILLYKTVNFSKNVRVVNVTDEDNTIAITLVPSDQKDSFESISLVFQNNPFKLQRINRTDSSNRRTTIHLMNISFDDNLDDDLFVFKRKKTTTEKKNFGKRSH